MSFFDSELEFKGNKTVTGVLQDFGIELQDDLIESLHSKVTGFTSKHLEQSIVFEIKGKGVEVRFVLKMDKYGDYIDEGVAGNPVGRKSDSKFTGQSKGAIFKQNAPNSQFRFGEKPPPINNELRTWANSHGINVYALRTSIWRSGIKPNNWYSSVATESRIKDLVKDLEVAGAKGIAVDVADKFKGKVK